MSGDGIRKLQFGPFGLLRDQRELRRNGGVVPLGGRALDILIYLVERPGEIVSKKELIDYVWPDVLVEEGSLRVHIAAIRKALGDGKVGNRYIANVQGRGYSFVGAVVALGGREADSQGRQYKGNLPTRALKLVERNFILGEVRESLLEERLITLVGPGGIGKSSLAIELGRGVLGDFEHGGWLVELASLADQDLVPSEVARVLGLKLISGAITAEAVARTIGDDNLLLILDNCEHVIDAASELADAVARFCPRVSVLATSREVLRVDSERVFRIPPLSIPDVGQEDPERVLRCGAAELLMTRMRALNSAFAVVVDDIPSIAAICRQLDGIPLAIEFAAARAATLGFRRVAEGLDDRFGLLTNGRRTASPRHQTLRAALDWSYELLSLDEQQLLCHLAIFPGAFAFEGAVAVGATELTGDIITDRISSLAAKSFLMMDHDDSAPRWRLLETIRAYALQKLAEGGEYPATALRHAEYVRAIIVPSTIEPTLTVEDFARQAQELDNVRAALDWLFSPDGDAALGAELVAAFAPVWVHLLLVGECRRRAEQVLGMAGSDLQLSRALKFRFATALGEALTFTLGPVQRTREVISEARQLSVGFDDTEVHLQLLWSQWSMEHIMGEYGASSATAHLFAECAGRHGDDALMLVGDRLRGTSMMRMGELNGARHCLERVVNHYFAPSDGRHAMLFRFDHRILGRAYLARVLALQGFLDQAAQEAQLSLEEARASDKVTFCAMLHYGVLPVALMTGDHAMADEAVATISDLATTIDAGLWKIVARCCKGEKLIARSRFAEGSALLREALDQCERDGWRSVNVEFLGDLARGLAGLERFDEAIATLDRALTRAESGGGHWCKAELIRLKGEVLLQQRRENETLAEDRFLAAIEVARTQGAIFWELRAALSAARLRVSREDLAGAAQVLEPAYNRFSEGFDTIHVHAAKQLLGAIRSGAMVAG